MKIKKILAAFAAAALTLSLAAVNAFAATVEMDSEYPGAWASSKNIPKSEFEAIGGDVKVVVTYETKEPLIGEHNHLAKPMDVNWNQVTDRLTSDTMIAKGDGFIAIPEGEGTIEFVVPADLIAEFDDNGLAFQVCDVILKSAELSAGSAEGEVKRIAEEQAKDIMEGKSYEEVTGGASTDAPATGNVPAAVMASVMAVAGVAVVASRKRK